MNLFVFLRLQVLHTGKNQTGYVNASLLVALCIKDNQYIPMFLGIGPPDVALVILIDVPLLTVAAKHLTSAMVFV